MCAKHQVETLPPASYAEQLQRCLQWNPVHGIEGKDKQEFVDALTEIAALPLDSISMEIRRLLVVSLVHQQSQSPNIIAALSARDVQLKCKAAIALGSLCISRVAGQQLLGWYGREMLKSLTKMATRKNQWVQGDAFFVLGWMVVVADEGMVMSIAEMLPTTVKYLHRNVKLSVDGATDGVERKEMASRLSEKALASSEQASNFRVYALVLLLNLSQRHVDVFVDHLESVLLMLKDLVVKLLDPISPKADNMNELTGCTRYFDAFEYAEVLRLGITLLSVLSDQLVSAAPQLLKLKVLPALLKLQRKLYTSVICDLVDEVGRQDAVGRLEAVIARILDCR